MTARAPEARPCAWDVAESAQALIGDADPDAPAITGMMAANDVATDDLTEVIHVGMVDAVEPETSSTPATELTTELTTEQIIEPSANLDPDLARTAVIPTSAERQDVFATPQTPVTGEPLVAVPRKRRTIWIVLAVILLVLVAAAVVYFIVSTGQQPPTSPSPSLPAVGGQLGEDLRELMRSVTP
jgi:hypothetical protein